MKGPDTDADGGSAERVLSLCLHPEGVAMTACLKNWASWYNISDAVIYAFLLLNNELYASSQSYTHTYI